MENYQIGPGLKMYILLKNGDFPPSHVSLGPRGSSFHQDIHGGIHWTVELSASTLKPFSLHV